MNVEEYTTIDFPVGWGSSEYDAVVKRLEDRGYRNVDPMNIAVERLWQGKENQDQPWRKRADDYLFNLTTKFSAVLGLGIGVATKPFRELDRPDEKFMEDIESAIEEVEENIPNP